MANTTDIMVTTFTGDEDAIQYINKETGINLTLFTEDGKASGPKAICFECYGTCFRCVDGDLIDKVIQAFKSAKFDMPEYAILFIDDDNGRFEGVITLDT